MVVGVAVAIAAAHAANGENLGLLLDDLGIIGSLRMCVRVVRRESFEHVVTDRTCRDCVPGAESVDGTGWH